MGKKPNVQSFLKNKFFTSSKKSELQPFIHSGFINAVTLVISIFYFSAGDNYARALGYLSNVQKLRENVLLKVVSGCLVADMTSASHETPSIIDQIQISLISER